MFSMFSQKITRYASIFFLSLSIFTLSTMHAMDNYDLRYLQEEFVESIVNITHKKRSQRQKINAAVDAVSEGSELLRQGVKKIYGRDVTNDDGTFKKRFPRVFKKTSSHIVVATRTERAKKALIALLEAPTEFSKDVE